MLTWFRKIQTTVAPLMVAVFLGSLFTLFCQDCLVKLEQVRQTVAASSLHEGHCAHNSDGQPESTPPAKPCMGVCDCGDHAMLIADKHSLAMSDSRGFAEIKILIPPAAYTSDYTPRVLAYVIGKPDKPDRACFTPLERNCVLLN